MLGRAATFASLAGAGVIIPITAGKAEKKHG